MALTNKFDSAPDAVRFMLSGKSTVTLSSMRTGTRFTFRISAPQDTSRVHFVGLLRGNDNESDYSYIGYIRDRKYYVHGGAKSKVSADAPSSRAFRWAWERLIVDEMPAELEVWHEGRCGRCNRLLTVPSSIASGLGPECSRREVFRAS